LTNEFRCGIKSYVFLGRGNIMRGRKPHLASLSESDRGALQRIIRRGKTEQRVARRARVLLAMEKPQTRVERLAEHLEMGRTTIWELCRRYEGSGIEAIYDSPRLGRPRVFSPLGESSDRATCLLRAGRYRIGDDPLVNKNSGEDSGRTGDSSRYSAFYNFPSLEDSGSAASSQSILENANLECGIQASCKSYSLVL
jgi:biotin operon repressor